MTIYLCILALLSFLAAINPYLGNDDKNTGYLYVFSFLILFLFSGIRYDVGVDYLAYEELYENSLHLNEEIKEPGFAFLFYIFRNLGVSFEIVNFFLSFFIIFYAFKFIWKYSPYPFISLLIFYSTGQYYFNTFNAIRQALAIYIFWCSLDLIRDRKMWAYFCRITLISLFFHMSAILLLPLYFIIRKSYSFWLKIGILLTAILGSEIIVKLIGASSYGIYLQFDQFASDIALTTYLLFLFSIIFLIIDKFYPRYSSESPILANLNFLSLLTLTLVIVFRGTPLIMIANRFSYYFTPVYIILIPLFISKLTINTNRKIILSVLILFYGILCYIALVSNGLSNRMVPYQTIFEN